MGRRRVSLWGGFSDRKLKNHLEEIRVPKQEGSTTVRQVQEEVNMTARPLLLQRERRTLLKILDLPDLRSRFGYLVSHRLFHQYLVVFSVFGLLSPTGMQVNKNGWVGSIGTPAAQRWIFQKKELFCKPHVLMLVRFHKKSCSASFVNFPGCVCALLTAGKGRGPGGGEGGEYWKNKKSVTFLKLKRWRRKIISFSFSKDRDPANFGLVEKWRKIERPLSGSTKVWF